MNRIEISFAEPMSLISHAPSKKLELLESLERKNQTALGTLIDRYHSRLLQLAMMFVQDKAEAVEVVQEMRVKILESIQQDEGRSCLEILISQVLTKRSQTRENQESWKRSSHVH